jgi:OMF family outer membrane factor
MAAALLVTALLLPAPSPARADDPPLPAPGRPTPVYSLADCLQLALDRNPDILKAQRDIERTQGLIITAKATLYPQLSLNGRIEERDDDLFSQGTDPTIQRFRDYWTIQLQVEQSLYSGGINRQQIAIAKLEHEAALIQLQATVDDVLNRVKHAVYEIVIDQAQIDAETKTIDLLGQEESRQQALFDAGRTTRFNVLRTQVSLTNQSSTLNEGRNSLIAAQVQLAQLLGIEWVRTSSPLTPPFIVREPLDTPPLHDLKVDDLIALALTRRPELQVVDRQIDIASRRIKIDKAATLPQINAYAAEEDRRDQSRTSFNDSVNDYAVGLLGTWNVFDGFASKGLAISDTASLDSTLVSRDALRLKIESDVREAFARLMTAQATIDAQNANVKTAEESARLSQVSADTGYATLLDVLQATLDLTAARSDAIRAQLLYLEAKADLERAVSVKFVDWPAALAGREPAPALFSPVATPPTPALHP